jgi:hypothetical protein
MWAFMIVRRARSLPATVPFRIFGAVTASALSCGVPTLFGGRIALLAASPNGVQLSTAITSAVTDNAVVRRSDIPIAPFGG